MHNLTQAHTMKNKEIKKAIRKYLDDNFLTMRDFCRQSHISQNTLYPLMSRDKSPSRLTALRLVRATKGKITLEDCGHGQESVE